MKRNFLLLCVFFLTSCTASDFSDNSACPLRSGRKVIVQFEYDSAELNEKAVRKLESIAKEVKEKNQYVCFWGRLSYQGVPSGQALGAIDRARNTEAIFLKEGVDPAKMYIGISADEPRIGFSKPQKAADERHILDLLIGN